MPDLVPPLADLFPQGPAPYLALILVGFAIGTAGHVFRARWVIVAGIALIFLGALLLPVAANLTMENRPPPLDESRGESAP